MKRLEVRKRGREGEDGRDDDKYTRNVCDIKKGGNEGMNVENNEKV